jgi:predicted glycosyltransferase
MALVDGADDDLAIELYNTIEDMLSRKTPAVVIGRAAELEPRLANLGGDKLQARLAELVKAGGASE